MFTGIIKEVGRVQRVTPEGNGVLLDISASASTCGDLQAGDSIALDGVCQTILESTDDVFQVAAESETLRVTTLGSWHAGDRVNLERALPAAGRLDGHLVLGHVDGTAEVVEVRHDDRTHVLVLQVPQALRPYVVPKGCVALDGVSLTVGPQVHEGRFEVYLIPYTWQHTTLCDRPVGSRVNLETDILARTVVHLLQGGHAEGLRASLPQGLTSWDELARPSMARRDA
jgi:riboflavin synthase